MILYTILRTCPLRVRPPRIRIGDAPGAGKAQPNRSQCAKHQSIEQHRSIRRIGVGRSQPSRQVSISKQSLRGKLRLPRRFLTVCKRFVLDVSLRRATQREFVRDFPSSALLVSPFYSPLSAPVRSPSLTRFSSLPSFLPSSIPAVVDRFRKLAGKEQGGTSG